MGEEKESSDIRKYLRDIGIAREKGGSFFERSLRVAGTVKGASIIAANMINKAFKHKGTDVITIKRADLPIIFGSIAIQEPKAGKQPTLKKTVRKFLRDRGIIVQYSTIAGIVDFIKAEPKKY